MEINTRFFQTAILEWYQQYGRKQLPWQIAPTPYKVWLSEIMLQQTQVATVIPYYERFLKHFPDIFSLAQAHVDDVMHFWSGLGYYARARNLHRTAQILVTQYQGQFPLTIEGLEQLPGIGRSTAGAVLSLSQNIRAPILDGNVKRVLIRYFAMQGNSNEKNVLHNLWQLTEQLTPHQQVREYNQAMMDLGAMICIRSKPLCAQCPLKINCQAFQQDLTHLLPEKKTKIAKPEKSIFVLVLQNSSGAIYLEKRPNIGIWGGLWSLPEADNLEQLEYLKQKNTHGNIDKQISLNPIRHIFTHFQLNIQPILIQLPQASPKVADKQSIWYDGKQKVGLPKPIKALLETLELN